MRKNENLPEGANAPGPGLTPEAIEHAVRICGSKKIGGSGCFRCPLQGVTRCVNRLFEALAAENARLREENRWIPVSERLPDKDGWYEVWTSVKNPHLGQQFNKAQFYCGEWHGNGGRWTNVTHWKPLSKGPEVGHE